MHGGAVGRAATSQQYGYKEDAKAYFGGDSITLSIHPQIPKSTILRFGSVNKTFGVAEHHLSAHLQLQCQQLAAVTGPEDSVPSSNR